MRPGEISVINRHHLISDRLPDNAVYVGRPSPLGNPFPLPKSASLEERNAAIRRYHQWLSDRIEDQGAEFEALLQMQYRLIAGESLLLACWCHPKPCHADVIKGFLLEAMRQLGSGEADDLVLPEISTAPSAASPQPRVIAPGDQVVWLTAPPYLEFLNPLRVTAVEPNCVWCEWVAHSIPIANVQRCTEVSN